MNKDELVTELYRAGAIKIGKFVLKSGATSSLYVDLREAVTKPYLLKIISNALIDLTKSLQFDLLCGVPYSALPIATCMSLSINKPMLIVRKEQKEHGTKKQIEGTFEAGQKCLVIEDVITTASSIINTIDTLHNSEIAVPYVVSVLDREQGGHRALQEKHMELRCILTLTEMKNILSQLPFVTAELRGVLENVH